MRSCCNAYLYLYHLVLINTTTVISIIKEGYTAPIQQVTGRDREEVSGSMLRYSSARQYTHGKCVAHLIEEFYYLVLP